MHDGVPFGRFVLVRKLGSGGMGELFLARPREPAPGKLPERLAVKRIHPAHRGDVAFAQSLLDEAVIGVHLLHPHIVRTYDVGDVDGDVYIAMEYVEGETLAALLARGATCPPAVAVAIGAQLASALEYLHAARAADGRELHLVHRDVSPANVMLDREGSVRLIDFGIARASVTRAGGTRPGEIKANLDWAAPEQLNGVAVDARADIWGAGAVLYALLTGASSPRERPLRAARPDVPEELAALVDACLQTVPADRPADLRARLEALGPAPREVVVQWMSAVGVQRRAEEAPAPRTAPLAAPAVRGDRFKPGDTVARCTILGRYGGGGMGELWLARQAGSGQFEKTLLLKTISGEAARSQQFVRMFLEEARLAALINHPNVVQVFDCGEDRGCWYLSMEYLDGRDLGAVARALKEPMPVHLAARIAAECAAGLDFAHRLTDSQGRALRLVHRDVTPDNVVVTYSGQVKLVDFGIAKAAGGGGGTQIGAFKGKLAYASPEQVQGRALDARADVWSLGVVLYELCTGRKPFEASSEHELMRAILSSAPARPGTPIDAVILRALEKDPARRYADAAAMRAELEAFLATAAPSSTFHLAAMMERLFPAASDGFRGRVRAVMSGTRADAAPDASKAATVIAALPVAPRRRVWPVVAAAVAVAVAVAGGVTFLRPPSPLEGERAGVRGPVSETKPAEPPPTAPTIAEEDSPAPAPDEPPLTPSLSPTRGAGATLVLSCNVACDLFVDGRRAGRGQVSVPTRPGKHTVRAVASGAGRAERTVSVSVEPGETASRKLTFDRGELIVRATPWADVTVDGKPIGQTPLPKFELYEGKHEVVFKNPELKATERRSVVIRAGEAHELSVTF